MLTQVEVFGAQAPQLVLPIFDAEDSPVQIKEIEGLGPVKATINTSPYGVVSGEAITGTSVGTRNVVLTLGLNPDWETQTYEELRKLLYRYFMPQSSVTLQFTSTHLPKCKIDGVVEDMSPNMFSQDPEVQVSIICGRPEFIAVDLTSISGVVGAPATPDIIDYEGTAATGINLTINSSPARNVYTGDISVVVESLIEQTFSLVNVTVDPTHHIELNSIPGDKYIQSIDSGSPTPVNLLGRVADGYAWPVLVPGENALAVNAGLAGQAWTVSYFAKFGGL